MFLENTVNVNEQFGWIEVICGSMFSGKTEELIRRLKRAKIAKQSSTTLKFPNSATCIRMHANASEHI